MSNIVRIDEEVITTEELIRILRLTGRFDAIVEDVVREKLTAHAARRSDITVSDEEIQERADQFRRVMGLHRAKDTLDYLNAIGATPDDFERFIADSLYQEKMMARVADDAAVEEYFRLHSPRFDSVQLSHIVVDNEGAAREIVSMLKDGERFADLAAEHSLAESRANGGVMGRVLRGTLPKEVEVRLFNAAVGDILGPFPGSDGESFEVFRVDAKSAAQLDGDTRFEIRRLLKEAWFAARAKEHRIEAL